MELIIKDLDGRKIEYLHIVAVRYVWNSYVGVAHPDGLHANSPMVEHAFFSPHSYENYATYQILGT